MHMEKYKIKKVLCVRYELKHLNPVELPIDAPAYTIDDENVSLTLVKNIATIIVKKNTDSIEEAKLISLPYVQRLETIWHVQNNKKLFEFEYIHADIVVEYPSSGEIRTKRRMESFITIKVTESHPLPIKLVLQSNHDSLLIASPTAIILAERYKQYLEKQESLTWMGYFCYTVIKDWIETATPKDKYNIESKVLKTLSKLTSILGDTKTARKLSASRPHTKAETDWIECAIKLIMLKISQVESGRSMDLQKITMSALPNLDEQIK